MYFTKKMAKDFAVVKIGAAQYKVSKGDNVQVEKLDKEVGKKVVFNEVLLASKKGKLDIGTPTIKSAKVEAKIIEQYKGKKIKVFKYMAKSRYRRHKGHRQNYTKIEITKI